MIVNFGFMLGRRAARCTVVLGCSVLLEADCRGESLLSFGRDIRPILSNNCYACHGPDKSTRKPKKTPLRLDLEKEAHEILPRDRRADGFSNTAYNLAVDLKHIESYAKLAGIIVSKMDVTKFAARFSRKQRLIDDDDEYL